MSYNGQISMQRKEYLKSVDQSNDASCIGNKRGMARKAKRNSAKKIRQALKKENQIDNLGS